MTPDIRPSNRNEPDGESQRPRDELAVGRDVASAPVRGAGPARTVSPVRRRARTRCLLDRRRCRPDRFATRVEFVPPGLWLRRSFAARFQIVSYVLSDIDAAAELAVVGPERDGPAQPASIAGSFSRRSAAAVKKKKKKKKKIRRRALSRSRPRSSRRLSVQVERRRVPFPSQTAIRQVRAWSCIEPPLYDRSVTPTSFASTRPPPVAARGKWSRSAWCPVEDMPRGRTRLAELRSAPRLRYRAVATIVSASCLTRDVLRAATARRLYCVFVGPLRCRARRLAGPEPRRRNASDLIAARRRRGTG